MARLVRLTVTHDPADDDRDGQVLCDADLAILASPPVRVRRLHGRRPRGVPLRPERRLPRGPGRDPAPTPRPATPVQHPVRRSESGRPRPATTSPPSWKCCRSDRPRRRSLHGMRDMSGEQVNEAVASCVALLRTAADRDWKAVRAGRLEWDCHATAFHIAEISSPTPASLAGRAQDDVRPLRDHPRRGHRQRRPAPRHRDDRRAARRRPSAPRPREVRAFHPYPFRSANREGFAAMGDRRGAAAHARHRRGPRPGVRTRRRAAAESVLTRLFPHVQPGPDHWRTLLWATGRGDLPGRAAGHRVALAQQPRHPRRPPHPPGRHARPPPPTCAAGGDGGFAWIVRRPLRGHAGGGRTWC